LQERVVLVKMYNNPNKKVKVNLCKQITYWFRHNTTMWRTN